MGSAADDGSWRDVSRVSDRVDAMQVNFMRIKTLPFELDRKDSYSSEWIGGDGGSPQELTGNGKPIIGMLARAGRALKALGLIHLE